MYVNSCVKKNQQSTSQHFDMNEYHRMRISFIGQVRNMSFWLLSVYLDIKNNLQEDISTHAAKNNDKKMNIELVCAYK